MSTSKLPTDQAVQTLRDCVRGDVVQPGDDGYDEARTGWNDLFEKYPSLIVRCTGAADVITAVDFVRERDVPFSVKSGGHDYAGNSIHDDGLVIDLSAMDAIRVDPGARTARIQPGATWADVDHETQAFGLATTGATVSTVGVTGYTLGGGTGHLARKHGLGLDNLRAADVATADGDLVRASEEENPDLFWALRGGSGNLGVVTSLEFDLHEVGPDVLAGQIVHPFGDARAVLERYDALVADAPDEVACYAFVIRIPPMEVFPEEYHGETAISIMAAYAGDIEEGETVLQSIREFGDPILDGVRPQPYTALQQAFDDGMPKGNRWYSRAHYLADLPDEAIDTIIEYTRPLPGEFTMVYLEPMGGAINRIPADATAFPHRDADYSLHIFPGWSDPGQDDELIEWAREFHVAMEPYAGGGVYVNLLGHDEDERVPAAYGGNYDRLAAIKREWDPDNLFRSNHNVQPSH